jgi:AraC family transcriptional regulator of adaptative response/methylated-DNA-[protein]-cysteine methyltransferase
MYQAMCDRDRSLDGAFFAAVKTTGIFCRPGCGAKKPRRENVEFYSTVREALHSGYRPCMRCRPLENGDQPPTHVQRALSLIEQHPDRRLRAADLREQDLNPERITRYFKQHYGLTFQAYHRARRVGRALSVVRAGSSHTRAATAAGYNSESGFREAFQKLFGASSPSPSSSPVLIRWLPTPLGPMLAGACDQGVCFLEFTDRRALEAQVAALRRRMDNAPFIPDPASSSEMSSLKLSPSSPSSLLSKLSAQLTDYFAGKRTEFALQLHAPGTPFQQQVWEQLQRIPHGQTRSYLDIAKAIKRPTATRAVARANGDNRLAILIPCHRVIGNDGSLTGYGGQIWRKEWLLSHEKQTTCATDPLP